jgi:hypothetical protein
MHSNEDKEASYEPKQNTALFWVLIEHSPKDRLSLGSIDGSTDWMVLHRPLELARLFGAWQ